MKNKLSKAVCLICAFSFLLYTSPAYANEALEGVVKEGVVTNVTMGDTVPFDGILLSREAAAKLYGELKFFESGCELRISKQLEIANLEYKTNLDVLELKLKVETERTESLLSIKDERINFLEQNWKPQPWYESGEFWMAVGVVSGILLTVGAAHAVGQASR